MGIFMGYVSFREGIFLLVAWKGKYPEVYSPIKIAVEEKSSSQSQSCF